ncbi:MAG: bifunctional lysylphosphatidylglycerol flippase/synthetase MprF [SAR324 cluster bacterium]|uniref:Bifunctional lysylphosphatidylglycerol flippase/synthetase MprF n=1 Tax=SAR324 cluster bacterium TaxID=2024889 RepID=A0A7X9IIP5_9DELT|nr:bifunctional lysylphosphatidylglycerol flippase/synthetase MprF [SAR324 cluster bacterium]
MLRRRKVILYYRRFIRKSFEVLKILVVPVILLAAFFALYKTAKNVSYKELESAVYAIPRSHLIEAFIYCLINYFVLTLYDAVAFRYIHHSLRYPKIAFTAVISFAFSQTVGFAILSGGAIRYRLYSSWGCSAQQITKLIAFSGLHFWMGLFLLSGLACLVVPGDLLKTVGISETGSSYIGIIFLLPIAIYLILTTVRKTPIMLGQWEIPMPSFPLAALALAVACLDWIVVAKVLHALLPASPSIPFHRLLVAFFLSQASGVLSHVPGGLGVFETVMLITMSNISQTSLLASLLLFRVVYYLLPFIAAILLLLLWEFLRGSLSARVRKTIEPVDSALSGIVPPLLALNAFLAGTVLMFSGVTPPARGRLWWIRDVLPLPLLEVSHFLNSVIATLLVILAWSIWKRVDAAYVMTLILFLMGAAVSLLKGLDYEEAILLLIMAAVLSHCRRYFYRKAAIFSGFRLQTLVAFLVIAALSAWLGIFVYSHISYSHSLWFSFSTHGDASRFMRAGLGSFLIILFIALQQALKPAPPPTPYPTEVEFEKVHRILSRSSTSLGNLALLGDKFLLFSERNDAFLMYRNSSNSWIALGDPVGEEDSHEELIWRLRDLADQHDGHCAFYQIPAESLFKYVDIGLNFIKLGEEALVDLSKFSLEAPPMKTFRNTLRKLENKGYQFSIAPSEETSQWLPQLKRISDAWLAEKNTSEKGFSMGFFYEPYLRNFPLALIKKDEDLVAFANIWSSGNKQELSIDLMRQASDAPNGIMDFLFLNMMKFGQENGYKDFNLGMAPLSGLEFQRLSPLWNKVGAFIYTHGEHFYNFEGLRHYKEKFNPRWEARYLAYQGKLTLPIILSNIAILISGGLKNLFTKSSP